MDYTTNTYLAITFSQSSPFLSSPSSLVSPFALNHVGQVGQLADTQLWSVPKHEWDAKSEDILAFLNGKEGVQSVDVQQVKQRAKRDEL